MHYPHKVSKIKKKRRHGFLARMRTAGGRAIISRQRRRRVKGRSG
jgi:ribosomal protein L34